MAELLGSKIQEKWKVKAKDGEVGVNDGRREGGRGRGKEENKIV